MRRLLILSVALLAVGCGARSTDHWLEQLKDPEVVKRREAIRELGERTSDAGRVVPALVEALRDESSYVRHDAAVALGKFGPEVQAATPGLVAALKDRDATVRKAAEAALKKVNARAAARDGLHQGK